MEGSEQYFWFGAAQFVFAPDGGKPTEILFRVPAMRMTLVDRSQLRDLDVRWNAPGIYFLLGSGAEPGTYRIYVGKSPAGVAGRVAQHAVSKEWWDRALMVVTDRSAPFTSTEVGWLEAHFIARLWAEVGQPLQNRVQPAGERLEPWIVRELEAHVGPIVALLRLLGLLSASSEPEIVNDEGEEVALAPEEAMAPARVTGNPSWVDAALAVLPEDGSSLHAREILERIRLGGHRDLAGTRTPENTLRRDLRQEHLKDSGRVLQTGPSMFSRRLMGSPPPD